VEQNSRSVKLGNFCYIFKMAHIRKCYEAIILSVKYSRGFASFQVRNLTPVLTAVVTAGFVGVTSCESTKPRTTSLELATDLPLCLATIIVRETPATSKQ